MAKTARKGAEEARSQLPHLLEAAERGQATIITRRGRAVAALVPMKSFNTNSGQQSLLPLVGSGRGLWGRSSARTLRELRDEWDR